MADAKARASGPLWAAAHDDGTIIDSDGVYRDLEDAENVVEWLNSSGQVHAIEVPVRLLPGHGKLVPVELLDAVEDAVHEAAIRGCSWCCPCAICSATGNVESAIRAAREGAL